MVTQRKRHLQEASRSLHHGILPLQDDDDDDNSKQHRKRRSVRRHTPTMIQSVLLTVLSLIILFWLNGWASDVLVRKQTGPVVVLLFPDVAKPSPGIARPRSRYTSRIPDWGGLELSRIRGKSFQRRIHRHDEEHYNEERHEFLHEIDEENEEWASAYDEHIEEYSSCQPTNWKNKIFPVCNTFHELQRNWGSDQLLGKGYYRAAWKMPDYVQKDDDSYFVFKQLKLPDDDNDWAHLVHVESLFKIQREAIIMERLSASPRIVDIYGHCGTSILSECMASEISNQIIPNSGHGNQRALDALPEVPCNNEFTLQEKIDIALEMAESIADMHGYEGGVMVNGDIHPVQWLRSKQGAVKLNDFNNADLLDWDVESNEYCKLDRGRWGGMYRSPEEFFGTPQDEKIDVYAMGNNIYTLLTGLWPFYEYSRYTTINTKVKAGERPYVDPRYRNHSYVEGRLVEIMERMWHQRPEDRPEIFEVVKFLRETKETFEQEQRL